MDQNGNAFLGDFGRTAFIEDDFIFVRLRRGKRETSILKYQAVFHRLSVALAEHVCYRISIYEIQQRMMDNQKVTLLFYNRMYLNQSIQ